MDHVADMLKFAIYWFEAFFKCIVIAAAGRYLGLW